MTAFLRVCACVRPPLSLLSECLAVALFVCSYYAKTIKIFDNNRTRRRSIAKAKQRNLIAITHFCRLRTNTYIQAQRHTCKGHTQIGTHIYRHILTHTSLFSTHFLVVLEFGQLATFVWSTRTCAYIYIRMCVCMSIYICMCACVKNKINNLLGWQNIIMNKCKECEKNNNKIKANKKPVLTNTHTHKHARIRTYIHIQSHKVSSEGKKKLQRCCQRRCH